MLSETSCGPLCQHPACWASINQQLKGVRRRQEELRSNKSESSDEEDALPTQKVYNMLDEYGSDPRDKFPSRHKGKPKERRSISEPVPYPPGMSMRTGTTAPFTTPITMSGGPRKFNTPQITEKDVKNIPQFNKVEVQELFDLEDLQKDWHETFYASKCYVWVPGTKKTPRKPDHERVTISKLSQGPVPLPTRDMTESMVPIELERQREAELLRRHRRTESPRVRPRSMDANYINLLDLPRDILRAVLDNLEESNEITREQVQRALLQVIPAFSRHETALTLSSNSILRQQKVTLMEGQNRNVRQPELYQTKPAFQLDEGPQQDGQYEAESVISSNREICSLADYPPGHGRKKPLPSLKPPSSPKRKDKMTSISLGLPEIPTGYKYTKPFTYYKGTELDFALAPVSSIAPSERETITRESDIESTLHVTIPSVASERDELDYIVRRRPSGEGLHVSPEDSTNVPKTPAATPASRSKTSGGQGLGSEVIQMPVLAPPTSPVSMDTAALGPIREISFDVLPTEEKARQIQELQNSHSQLKSRGGRSVRFAAGISTPTTPTPGNTAPNTPISRGANKTPATRTTATSLAVAGAQISHKTVDPAPGQPGPTLVIREKDSSVASSPEPWPAVNEDEFMKSPDLGPQVIEMKEPMPVTPDSKLANYDERSLKALTTPTVRSDSSPGMRPELSIKLMPDSDFSPAPPPPSPEMRLGNHPVEEDAAPVDISDMRSTKDIAMLPVLEEENTDGNATDRTDKTKGEPDSVSFAHVVGGDMETEFESMASDAVSNLMSRIGSNFPSADDMMEQILRRNSQALISDILQEDGEVGAEVSTGPEPVSPQQNDSFEMTEDGGDHEGFKQDLQEELGNIEDKIDERDDKENEGGKGGGFGAWNWVN